MADLLTLADRVRALQGPDREVDEAIWIALGGRTQDIRELGRHEHTRWFLPDGERVPSDSTRLTESLDAVIALAERVMPGCEIEIDIRRTNTSVILYPTPTSSFGDHASTPALALLAALLTAKAGDEQ